MADEFMDDGDSAAFDESYAEWTVKELVPLESDALRTICRLWYGRGVARGTEWMESEVERITQEVKGGQQQ